MQQLGIEIIKEGNCGDIRMFLTLLIKLTIHSVFIAESDILINKKL